MSYERVNWTDYPSTTTPISAENLNIMDEGIANNAADISDIQEDISDINSSLTQLLVVGSMQIFAGSTVPDGYLLCDGSAVSRTTYADLFAVIGTTWGSGDGSTTFNIPDMREVAPVGVGTSTRSEGAHDAFTLGEFKDDQVQNHTHTTRFNLGVGSTGGASGVTYLSNSSSENWTSGNPSGRTGTVTRGKRIGVNYIIKY